MDMSHLNRVSVIGHLGKDPDVRTMGNGNKVVSFSMGVTKKWRDRDGNRKEKTEWVPVVIYNEGLVGVAEQYLAKGSKVLIEGEFTTREWEKNGEKRYTTEVVLNNYDGKLVLLGDAGGGSSRGGRDDGDDDRGGGGGYQERSRGGGGRSSGGGSRGGSGGGGSRSMLDDDIPFNMEWRG